MHRRRTALAVSLALVLTAPLAAQQQPGPDGGATEAQLQAARVEVPQLVKLLELQPGMTVADVGVSVGAWISRSLAPTGRVYASDIGEQQLAALR